MSYDTTLGLAQVHAIRAIVDEQRTASLLAYLAIAERRGAKDDATRALDGQIRARLCLTTVGAAEPIAFQSLDEARDALSDVLARIPDALLPELWEGDGAFWYGGLGFPIGGAGDLTHVEFEIGSLLAATAADRETARRQEASR